MPIIVDFIDIRKSGKVFVFSCMLFCGCGIILDIYNPMGCLITTASVASLLIAYAIAFKEVVDKYVIPLRVLKSTENNLFSNQCLF